MYKVCTTLYGKKKLVSEEKILERPVVYGIIIHDGKILLVNTRRTGKLWFPGGGIDDDKSKEDALVREIMEEVGIKAKVEELFIELESYFYYDPEDAAFHQPGSFYLCSPITFGITDKKNPEKTDEAFAPSWYDPSNLKEGDFQDFGWEIFRLAKEFKKI